MRAIESQHIFQLSFSQTMILEDDIKPCNIETEAFEKTCKYNHFKINTSWSILGTQ